MEVKAILSGNSIIPTVNIRWLVFFLRKIGGRVMCEYWDIARMDIKVKSESLHLVVMRTVGR